MHLAALPVLSQAPLAFSAASFLPSWGSWSSGSWFHSLIRLGEGSELINKPEPRAPPPNPRKPEKWAMEHWEDTQIAYSVSPHALMQRELFQYWAGSRDAFLSFWRFPQKWHGPLHWDLEMFTFPHSYLCQQRWLLLTVFSDVPLEVLNLIVTETQLNGRALTS